MYPGYEEYEDARLFALLKEGDTGAFETIYDRYFLVLLNTCFKRLQSREESQELVQDIFLQLYVKRDQIGHTEHLSGYLHTLLRNRIIDRFRQQALHKKHHLQFGRNQASFVEAMPEAHMDGKILEEKISEVINELPSKCREVFLLSRQNKLSNRAIAKTLNISVSTVEKHIAKALRIMKSILQLGML